MRKLRVMLSVNAPWVSTGYGQQVLELLPYLKEDVDLAISAFHGLEGNDKLVMDGVKYYPKIIVGGDGFGGQALLMHGRDFKADILMTLQDVWVIDSDLLRQLQGWIPIVPIDHDPAPPIVLEKLQYAYRIISYSEFGHRELERNGLASTYIQHTVNTDLFRPTDQAEARKSIGLPTEPFVFGMVAANKDNPPRKSFQEAMDAFKMFNLVHPNSKLYFHVLVDQPGGFQIREYSRFIGIADHVVFIDPYVMQFKIGRKEMPNIYNSMDCLLMPSTNEGFGVPAIEAQACGVPVITTDFTSMSELVKPGETGYHCKVRYKRFTGLGSYAGHPDVQSLYDCMEAVYQQLSKPAAKKKMKKSCRTFIYNNYNTKKIYNLKWKPLISKLESEIIARKDYITGEETLGKE